MKHLNSKRSENRLTIIIKSDIFSFDRAVRYMAISSAKLRELIEAREITYSEPIQGQFWFKVKDLDSWLIHKSVKSKVCYTDKGHLGYVIG